MGVRSPKMKIPSGTDTTGLCITDIDAFHIIKKQYRPDVVVHCAGVCDLDVCEERPLWAHAMNTTGAQVVTDVFGDNSYIIYMSSDLVFSGNNPPQNGYSEMFTPDPVSVAGKTIALAEAQIMRAESWCILRLGLPIGASVTGDKGAVDFIDSRLRRGLPLTLFHDEFRSCIDCNDICEIVLRLIKTRSNGLFHTGGPIPFSLYDVGEWVRVRGGYDSELLKGISRFEEINGPPRIGDVALSSEKIEKELKYRISVPIAK